MGEGDENNNKKEPFGLHSLLLRAENPLKSIENNLQNTQQFCIRGECMLSRNLKLVVFVASGTVNCAHYLKGLNGCCFFLLLNYNQISFSFYVLISSVLILFVEIL